jgi:drug/metabolite transporter (DMT)-like permease
MNPGRLGGPVDKTRLSGLAFAAGSGVLYGSINVLAKPIEAHPFAKVAIAYLVAAAALSPWLRGVLVARADWPKVLTMGLVGGGLAPILLFYGLRETAAADAGLLLTMELVATAVLAMIFLHERYPGRDVLGLGLLLAAAASIALAGGDVAGSTPRGMLLVLGGAVAWGVDNAVSTRLVGSYRPHGLIALKGLLGGTTALVAAVLVGIDVPSLTDAAAMGALGLVSIAFSSILFYTALLRVGAARTSGMNIATTALVAAAGGALLLSEQLGLLHAVALALVVAGAALLARPTIPVAAGPA